MTAVINYGASNLQSVLNALRFLNYDAQIVNNKKDLLKCDKAILPGVGSFSDAMNELKKLKLDDAILEFVSSGKNILGICLGMQLFFKKGYEFKECNGLGLIDGEVVKFNFKNDDLKIPHVGWNTLNFIKNSAINSGLKSKEYLYFVHSYHAICDDKFVLAKTNYGYDFVSAIWYNNIFGFQPHPEKSHVCGLKILKNFMEL